MGGQKFPNSLINIDQSLVLTLWDFLEPGIVYPVKGFLSCFIISLSFWDLPKYHLYHLFIIYLLIAFGGIIVCCVWCMPFIVLCFCMLSLGLCVSMYIWIVYMITCTEVWVNQTCCYCLSEHRHTYDMYYYICECTNYTLHYITLHCMYMYTYTTLHTYRHTYIHACMHAYIHTYIKW